jgi:iron complex transport system substrate-binding protein
VGVSARSDFPEDALRLPVVSDSGRIDLERIVALQPDLVLAWLSGNPSRQLELLERRGIPVLAIEVRRLDDIPRLLRLVGAATGRGETGAGGAAGGAIGTRAGRHVRRPAQAAGSSRSGTSPDEVSGTHPISDVLGVWGQERMPRRLH